MNRQMMLPHEQILTKIQGFFEKDVAEPPSYMTILQVISWHLVLGFILGFACCMVLMYQINKRGIKDRVLDYFLFKMRQFISYLESLSSTTYGQAGCGTKRKTKKEVQANPQLAVSTITSTTNVSTDTIPIWSYDYLSSTRKYNQYSSMVLPRFCFLQVDYFPGESII